MNIQRIVESNIDDFHTYCHKRIPMEFHGYIYKMIDEVIDMKSRENISDEELLRIYMLGFNDELLDREYAYRKEILVSSWEQRAYANGRVDALISDMNSIIDLQTNEEILKRIKI